MYLYVHLCLSRSKTRVILNNIHVHVYENLIDTL